MRITLHPSHSSKLLELCENKGISPCQYIRDLIAIQYEEINTPKIALDAQKVTNAKHEQQPLRQDI